MTINSFKKWLTKSGFSFADMETYNDDWVCIHIPNEWENPKEKTLTKKRLYDFLATSVINYKTNHADGEWWPSTDFSCEVGVTEVSFKNIWKGE